MYFFKANTLSNEQYAICISSKMLLSGIHMVVNLL